jgi:hypothetical protein
VLVDCVWPEFWRPGLELLLVHESNEITIE